MRGVWQFGGPLLVTARPGLQATEEWVEGQPKLAIWMPFGFTHQRITGRSLVYFRRTVPLAADPNNRAVQVLNELLKGPTADEQTAGAFSLVGSAKVLDVRIERGVARVNFSGDLSPGGGSAAVWQTRTAVEELLRQLPSVKQVEIFIEGRPASEALQP